MDYLRMTPPGNYFVELAGAFFNLRQLLKSATPKS